MAYLTQIFLMFIIYLQSMKSTSMSSKTVDGPSVYACVAYPSPAEVRSLLDHVLNEPISTAYHSKLPR